ncbi:TonB-dependent receptor plug domain-containing protein [Massilia antarctica]|uniref:TonB-dependent receptor plug domain-containing protein n=1 Tax=Massilia antarctica TaxID=2765360 RepID=UPI0006BB78E3|nr:TonB-dependent receptor [Massilia sp. H27-R4]MCY0914972.1 TonB-dependent receptor [Massilia sp. H27-R4]CUI06938.1 TonB-dependent receptor; Outer membrane receptor for ferrienterochelin and colicins [Janthinobacterium sp. CG23_2]CUU30724.1 TonB-dependent receptor; Outer membrane receptor for ferrienterochelin and colicins [Janthinobacterium sp. CG23_2]
MQIRPYACACALALSSPALGADVLPKIEIPGARYDQRSEETAASLVVGREELMRHGDRSLGDALKRVPGITIGDGGGRASDIRLRGLGNGYTQVLLNGVAAPAGFSLESLAPELIERVEIARGASASTSMQAIAGSVNIVLRKSGTRLRATVKAGLDTQHGRRSPSLGGEFGGKDDAFSYSVPVSLSYSPVPAPSREEESGPGLRRSTRLNEDNTTRLVSLTPRANWKLDNGDTLGLQAFLSNSRRATDAWASETTLTGAPTRHPQRAAMYNMAAIWLRADLEWTRSLGEGARIEARGGIHRSRRESDFEFGDMIDRRRAPALNLVTSDLREGGYHAGASWTRPLGGGHTFAAGWDGAHTTRSQTRVGSEHDTFAEAPLLTDNRYHGIIDRLGLFAQDGWEISPAWSLSAGLRWEALRTSVAEAGVAAVRQRSVIPAPVLQALYKPAADHQLRAGLARTYKAPTMGSLIPRRYTVDNNNSATNPHNEGNPALRPEKAWGLDVGYDRQIGKDGLLAASAYARRIDDVTVTRLFQDGADWVATPANQGRASARGVALEAKLPLPGFTRAALNGNVARNWSRIDKVQGPDNRLAEQAPLTASLGIDIRAALTVGASFTYARGAVTRYSPVWREGNGGNRLLDMYVLWGAGKQTRLRVGLSNALRRSNVSQSDHGGDGGMRSTRRELTPGAVLRITFEHDVERPK